MRTLLWIIFVYDELMLLENFWWICPNRCKIDSIKFQTSCIDMAASSAWMLKVQFCGIANEDRAGCGGVLRDKEGVARALFLGPVAANDTDLAEIGAVMVDVIM
ncbi:hypothetical protein Goari_023310, partial [Gossypium aridum]|nr:hypothetical protein [Gossypium aridum]